MPKRTDKLTELVLQKIEALRVQHGSPEQPMKQKTLARRSRQSYARVHKFIAGQMPYPPMDFLNALLVSFGTSLVDVLKGETESPRQLPILRQDVQRVADTLDGASAEVVEEVQRLAELFQRARAASEPTTGPGPALQNPKKSGAGGTRGSRGARRGKA